MRGKHWTITKNHLEPDVTLPDAPPEHTIPFQLFDDDRVKYYSGLMSEQLYNAGERIFDPLDWATYDSGCTGMKVNGPNDNGFTWV